MTKEDKELLLRDLCARLPYGVKISIPELWLSEKKIEVLYEIYKGDDDLYSVNNNGMLIEDIKPYLFPLSSMTEEQDVEFLNTCVSQNPLCWTLSTFKWLNKNHFDYNYLIDDDLANDATNLGIYE